MKKSLFAALLSLIVILPPPWVVSRENLDEVVRLKPGYVEVEDIVWKGAQGEPKHSQRGLFSVYIPTYSLVLEPGDAGSTLRHDLLPGRYEAVAYSSKGKFNVVITFRDHSPFHGGIVSNTYYVEYFSFEVQPEKVTSIQGYIGPFKTENLAETDRRNSGGYTAYWEPRIETIKKKSVSG
jgi:hypothetical protein